MDVFLQLTLLLFIMFTLTAFVKLSILMLFDLIKFTKILTVNNVVRSDFAKDTSHFALTVKPETLRQG